MNDTIRLILSLSLSGSILAILIFAVKSFIKHKISKSIQYYIWIVVILRLLLPFSFEGSIMNNVFYGEQTSRTISYQHIVLPMDGTSENTINSSILPIFQENEANGVYNSDINYSRYFKDLFNTYGLYIWLLGVIIALTVNLTGYTRFSKYLKQSSMPATDEENRMLATLLNGRNNVRLVRNRFATTPMLIGIIKPLIIIPDIDFHEKQLKNILLHEIVHLNHYDILVKWITMIALSIHWFNPLMNFIKKEINQACELACDEAVIKNLNPTEKQAYGDTLISVVAERKYPIGVLQATMCEEKKNLKERLIAIMKHDKKSSPIIISSAILLVLVIVSALYLGAGVGTGKDTPPNIYISAEEESTKVALMGSYSWEYRGIKIQADSDLPTNFDYKSDNIVSVAGKQQLIIGTQKLKSDKKYDFTIEQISVYKDGQLIDFKTAEPFFMNGELYIMAPPDAGEYIYCLVLNYKDKGTVSYGFVVRVDLEKNKVTEIDNHEHNNISITFENEHDFPKQYKEQFSNYITTLFTNAYNPYYEVKGFEFSNVKFSETNTNVEITFFLKMITQNYNKDPDTVGYIKEAKENGSNSYQQLYDEYNQPKESNYDMKFTAKINDDEIDVNSIKVFGNAHPKGVEYVPIERFFPNGQ